MCYSKEVQLLTSVVILSSALAYYLYYSRQYRQLKKDWLLRFLKHSTAAFFLIGAHQFFEFLTLVTGSERIYKMGLIVSVCAVYFFLTSLETLTNKKINSWVAIVPIVIVSLQIIFSQMEFSEVGFYIRHKSTFFWAATWLFLFIYWHVSAATTYYRMKDKRLKKTLVIYLLTLADISFILSAIYVLAGHFLFSVNVCTDAPSIWCTFYAIQSVLVPLLFFRLGKPFKRSRPSNITIAQTIKFMVISLVILVVLILTLPYFDCLTWKFVFP